MSRNGLATVMDALAFRRRPEVARSPSLVRSLLSVGGLTLLSRGTGFLRDIVIGAVLGAGAAADAFFVAFRLPNHFRAIFGEGAFNAAYVPSYVRVLEEEGLDGARTFAGQILTLLLASQVLLLVVAWTFMPDLVRLLAPGFDAEPQKFDAAVHLTRITFPYLLCITLVTLHSGTLNAHRRFAAAAFAPVLLNVVMVGFLALGFLFPGAGDAAAWGVTASGMAQLALVIAAARRAGVLEAWTRPRWTWNVSRFFRALGPAVIGSAGVQIALFADTIIASMLPTGAVSSIYYADRLYQLPLGVIGIAAGTVLLPEMSRFFATGDTGGAIRAQNRTMALTVALAAPFAVAFLCLPILTMRAVFVRGAFSDADAQAAGLVLGAYGTGLLAVVLIRSAVASFQAQGDTRTPMLAALAAVAVNVGLKLLLFRPFGAAGLAMATATGAWINLAILAVVAVRRGTMRPDGLLTDVLLAAFVAADACAAVAVFGSDALEAWPLFGHDVGPLAKLAILGATGALAYGVTLALGLRVLGVRLPARRPAR